MLDSGKLVEFDSPAALLRKPEGAFRSMVEEYGPEMGAALRRQAEEAERRPRGGGRPSSDGGGE